MELHTGKPNTPTKPGKSSRPLELGEEIVDFLSDQNGPTAKVKNPKTVEKANVTSSDIELLRKFMPDIAKDFEKFVDKEKKPVIDNTSDMKTEESKPTKSEETK